MHSNLSIYPKMSVVAVVKVKEAVVAVRIVMRGHVSHRIQIASAGAVAVALPVDELVKEIEHVARLLDAGNVEFRCIHVAAANMDRAASEQALSERQLELLVGDLVQVDLLLLKVEEACAADQLGLCQIVDRKRPRQPEKRALAVFPDVLNIVLCHLDCPLVILFLVGKFRV